MPASAVLPLLYWIVFSSILAYFLLTWANGHAKVVNTINITITIITITITIITITITLTIITITITITIIIVIIMIIIISAPRAPS